MQKDQFYIDAHTHLLDYDRESHLGLQKVLQESQQHNIRYIVGNTCCTKEFPEMELLYQYQQSPQGTQNKQLQQEQAQKSHQLQIKEQQMKFFDEQKLTKKEISAFNKKKPSTIIIPCFGIHPCYICEQEQHSQISKNYQAKNIHQENQAQQKKIILNIQQLKIQQQSKSQNDWYGLLRQYLLNNPTAHIGEIGLDFRKDIVETNPVDRQWQYFTKQWQLAIEMNRTVTVHCVRAYGQLLKFLKSENKKLKNQSSFQRNNNKLGIDKKEKQSQKDKQLQQNNFNNTDTRNKLNNNKFNQLTKNYNNQQFQSNYQVNRKFNVILHSYGGSKEITKSINKLQNMNVYFSLSLKHSKDILQFIPIQKLLLQTDAPYQNDPKIVVANGLATEMALEKEQKQFIEIRQSNLMKPNKPLLKQCKFFNKSILNNKPKNVIANYKQLAKAYSLDLGTFTQKISQNFFNAFRLLKK